jgi:hypothetical protein
MELTMKKAMFAVLVSVGSLALVSGCASKPLPVAAMPSPSLAAAVEAVPEAPAEATAQTEEAATPADAPQIGQRIQHHVELTVSRLPAPKTFLPGATTYVFWTRANDGDAWANAAHLEPSSDEQEAHFGYPNDMLFMHVTAETSADARTPSSAVVLSTRVSKYGACAHSVDQHDVELKIRMCRDEK